MITPFVNYDFDMLIDSNIPIQFSLIELVYNIKQM